MGEMKLTSPRSPTRFVDADDTHGLLFLVGVQIGHGGAEEDLVAVGLARRIDHLHGVEPLAQETDAPVDLAQAFLAVDVVSVLGTVAVAGRPGDRLDDLGPFVLQQMPQFALDVRQAARGHVVLHAARKTVGDLGIVVFRVGFPGEGLAHDRDAIGGKVRS